MTVGAQASQSTVDQGLTNDAVVLRQWAERVQNRQKQFGTLAALEAVGYTPTDAQTALNFINFMNTIAAIYFGTATQPAASNFDVAFAVLWAGQLCPRS